MASFPRRLSQRHRVRGRAAFEHVASVEGLGYHRRARALHRAACVLRDDYGGAVPEDVVALRTLPGVASTPHTPWRHSPLASASRCSTPT